MSPPLQVPEGDSNRTFIASDVATQMRREGNIDALGKALDEGVDDAETCKRTISMLRQLMVHDELGATWHARTVLLGDDYIGFWGACSIEAIVRAPHCPAPPAPRPAPAPGLSPA